MEIKCDKCQDDVNNSCEECCEHGDWMDSHCGYCGYYDEDRIGRLIDQAMDLREDQ